MGRCATTPSTGMTTASDTTLPMASILSGQHHGNRQIHFVTMQETTRKDVERVFGVLQAHWGIVCGAAICGNQILCGSWWHVVLFCTIWLLTTMVKGQPRTHDFAKHREQVYNLKQDVDHIMNFLKMHQNLGDQICTGNYLIMLWSICGPTMETQNFSVWVVHFK